MCKAIGKKLRHYRGNYLNNNSIVPTTTQVLICHVNFLCTSHKYSKSERMEHVLNSTFSDYETNTVNVKQMNKHLKTKYKE